MADDFEPDDFAPEDVQVTPVPAAQADDFQADDFAEDLPAAPAAAAAPAPGNLLDKARQFIQETKAKQQQEAIQRQQEAALQQQEAAAKDADPRNWSSTRFKKEMPKPRTPEEQAFYDATLADIKEREKGLFDRIMTDIFDRPGAATREGIRAGLQGKDALAAGKEAFAQPEGSETFQNEILRRQNEGLDPKIAESLASSLGPVSGLLSPEDRETVGRFIAGIPTSTLGLVADIATNPADLLLTVLGERALKYIGKIPLAGRTVGELATAKIPGTPEIFPKAPPAAAAGREVPVAEQQGIRIEGPQNPRQQRFLERVEKSDYIDDGTGESQAGVDFIHKGLADDSFDKAYRAGLKKEYKTDNPNIISSDVARMADAEGRGPLTPKGAAQRQAGVSAYSKILYEEILADPANAKKPVVVSAGISGGGKTGALRVLEPELLDESILYDTNLSSVSSGRRIIDAALKSTPERSVTVFYVDRDPIIAFEKGVLPRYIQTGRVVPIKTHLKNAQSRQAVLDLYELYKDDPRVNFEFVGNYGKKGEYTSLDVDALRSKAYNLDDLGANLERTVEESLRRNEITADAAEAFLGRKVSGVQAGAAPAAPQPVRPQPQAQSGQPVIPTGTPKAEDVRFVKTYVSERMTGEGFEMPVASDFKGIDPQMAAMDKKHLAEAWRSRLGENAPEITPDGDLVLYRGGDSPSLSELQYLTSTKAEAAKYGEVRQFRVDPADVSYSAEEGSFIYEPRNISRAVKTQSGRPTTPPTKPAQAGSSGPIRRIAAGAEDLYQRTFNRMQSLENISKEAKAAGHKLLPGEDPGLRARGYLGIQPKVQSVLEDKTFRVTPEGKLETTGEGLKPILKDHDRFLPNVPKAEKEKDLVEYLKARRIVEDLQRPRPDDPNAMIATPQQVSDAEATLQSLHAKYGENATVLEDTAKRLYDYQRRVLGALVDSGNMSQAGYNAILEKNPNYVPFDRVLDDIEFGGILPAVKERFSGAKSPVKAIKGSEREIHDPIESMIKNTYRILDTAERNTVARTVAKLADVLPGKIQILNRPDPRAIRYYENGVPQYMRASDTITDAMKGLNETGAGLLVKILSMPSSWLRTGATLTPEFMARNPIRDQFTALIQTKLGYKPAIDSTGAIADILGKKQVYYDWLRSGGGYSTITELSRENLKKTLNQLRGNKNILSKLNIISSAQDLSQLMEQATRLGIFKAAQRKELSAIEAGFQSREATVDFARMGSNMKEVNRLIAFFNANLQAMDKMGRTAAGDPVGLAAKGIGLITVPSVALYMLNRKDPDYKELPSWQKNLFWMFKWPGTDTYVRIPKPFTYGVVFGSAPERFLEYLDTKDPRAIDSLKQSLMDSATPIAGEPESILLPTAVKPIIENFANRSFFTGRPIVPESKTRLRASEQSGRYTSQTARAVGKAMDVSPAKFENLIGGYTGGLGRYALQLGDKIIDEVNKFTGKAVEPKRPTEITDVPLVKGFTSRSQITSPESITEFYEHKKKAETDYLTAKNLNEQGDDAGMKEVLADGNAEFYKLTRDAGEAISKLNAYADGLVKSGNYSEEELRKKLLEVDQKQLEIAKRVNKVVNAKTRKSK